MKFPKFIKKKESDESKRQKISKPVVHIVIKRLMGNMPIIVAEFDAVQDRDDDFNQKLINDEYHFKEDLDISKHKIIELLKYKLDLENIKAEDVDGDGKVTKRDVLKMKLKAIDKKIAEQEIIVKDLKYNDKKKVLKPGEDEELKEEGDDLNLIDEEYKLNQLKALRFVVQNEGDGTYEEINSSGARQMTFLLKEGVFYPYYHCATNVTLYPDIGSKRKIYKERQSMIDGDFAEENRNPFTGIFKYALQVIFVLLIISAIYWNLELQQDRQEFTEFMDQSAMANILEKAEGSYVKCADIYTELIDTNKEFINIGKNKLFNGTEPDANSGNVDLQ